MQRITFYERQKIELYLRMSKTHRWIGKKLCRDHTVIDREVEKNSCFHTPYTAVSAQRIANLRAKKTNKRILEKNDNKKLKEYVEEKLREDWSPEQIAGRLQENPPPEIAGKTISYEGIYQYIYDGEGQYGDLYTHLRTRRPKRRKKCGRRKKVKTTIRNRVSIDDRPEVVKEKKRFGDWETDSMIFSKQKSIISGQYEKKSQLCRITKLPNKTAEESENAIASSIESLPKDLWKTITRDNGTENAKHQNTLKNFEIQSYFCDPYSSWQKGGVENLNKLIRQYLPRNMDLDTLTDDDIYDIQEKLNNRPRKSLKYLTPNEIIAQAIESGALNS